MYVSSEIHLLGTRYRLQSPSIGRCFFYCRPLYGPVSVRVVERAQDGALKMRARNMQNAEYECEATHTFCIRNGQKTAWPDAE